MPYAYKVARVTFSGTVFSSAEIWNTGFYLGFAGADVGAINPGIAQAIHGPWASFYTSAGSGISASCFMRQVKVALLNTDGTTDEENIDYYIEPGPYGGGNGASLLPPQVSLVATLTSEHQRGLASKGRMYLPGINATIDTQTGKVAAALQGTIATNLETFFEAVVGLAGIPGKPILASDPATELNPARVGRNANITGLRVGNVYDTQRRRRNQLVEGYVTRVVTNP